MYDAYIAVWHLVSIEYFVTNKKLFSIDFDLLRKIVRYIQVPKPFVLTLVYFSLTDKQDRQLAMPGLGATNAILGKKLE